MSSSFPKVKGFKKDKRNLLESTNNLVVFGQAQTPQEVVGVRGRRLLRRGSLRQRRNSKSKPVLPAGPCSTTQKLDRLVRKIDLTNYFANTKPWNDPSNKKSFSNQQQQLQNGPVESSSVTAAPPADEPGDGGSTGEAAVISFQLPQQQASIISSEGATPDGAVTPSLKFVNAIVCPVCLKGFEPLSYSNVPVAEVMKHSLAAYQQQNTNGMIFKKNLEEGWGASTKPKCVVEPQDVVVAGNCGELFHRLCLRDWCSRGHRKSPRSSKPVANCPSCDKELKYTMCQEIEILRCFSRDSTMLHKEFIKVKHVNKELQILWPETNNYLAKIKREIQDTETLNKELRSKRRGVKSELKKLTADDLGIVMAKVTDVNTLKSSLAKQEKALEFMQQETLQIMRMYLLTILRKLKACAIPVPSSGDFLFIPEYASLIGRVPPALVPYLQDIVNDNESLALLSRILAPFRDDKWDESQKKYLELELVQKFATRRSRSPPDLTRPNTYVVSSSAPEVGDSDSDDVMVRKVSSSSSIEQVRAIIAASSVKASTATHEISTILSSSKPKNILRAGTLSNLTLACKDKPPKLLEVLEINDSMSTVDSNVLEERLMGLDFSPNGGGSVDKTYSADPTSPSLSSPSSAQYGLFMDDSSFIRISKDSLGSSTFADPSMSLHHYEQDSKYVRAIRQLMKQSSLKAPPATPATIATISDNSVAQSSKTDLPQIKEVVNIHINDLAAGSGQPSSSNSETNQLNDMLIAFMRQQKHLSLEPKYKVKNKNDDVIHRSKNTDNDNATVVPCDSPVVTLSQPPKNSEKSSEGSVGLGTGSNAKEKEESWITVTIAAEDANTSCNKMSESQDTPILPPETKPSSHSSCNTKPKSLDSTESFCEPIYTIGYQNNSPPAEVVHTDSASVADVGVTPRNDDEVSIAIMYIIEKEDEDDSEEEYDKSVSEDDDKTEENKSKDKDLMLPLPLPTKVLSPIYLTAEKTSNYSIIANESGSAPPVALKSTSSQKLFAPISWPRTSRMIPVDTPSNQDIVSNSFYPENNYFKSKNSLTSLLPPLPEEIAGIQKRKSESVVPVPTLFYENETGNNKTLPA